MCSKPSISRVLLLLVVAGLTGCAAISPNTVNSDGIDEDRVMLAAASGPAQTTRGGRTQKRGLPLTRAQKIGLWTGVAVLIGYLMADEDGSAVGDP